MTLSNSSPYASPAFAGFFFDKNMGKPVDCLYRNPHNCLINLDEAHMKIYRVVVRTAHIDHPMVIPALSAGEAAERAATEFGDVPCGITVKGDLWA
ncbi:hypothetical protein [Massilia sp.]|uniref:hypothetical protein n=1 Tax=Massilia sp. TaxID=1882437 RepID=UPI0028A08774|nr:hypothetical protein [Massilia sp.]